MLKFIRRLGIRHSSSLKNYSKSIQTNDRIRIHNNSNQRTRLLLDLNNLLENGKTDEFKSQYQHLSNKDISQSTDLSELLIDLSIQWNDSMIPSLLVLNGQVSKESASKVIDYLSIKTPILDDLQLNLIFKIIEKYQLNLNKFQINQLVNKLQNTNLSVSKVSLDYLLKNSNDPIQLYELIKLNNKLQNPSGVFISFKKLLSLQDLNQIDPRIISISLKIFNKNHKFQNIAHSIVLNLKDQFNSIYIEELINTLIKSKNSIDNINDIIAKLSQNLTKDNLSHLLRLNLIFQNFNNVEIILNKIFQSSQLSSKDYQSISKSLIKRGKFDECLKFVENIPIDKATPSYLLTIDHIINSRFNFNDGKDITDKDRFVIDGLSKKLISLPNDSFWKVINSLYFKYLLKKCDNKFELSKIITIYENSNKNFIQKKQQHESSLLLNPFNEFNTEYYKTNHNSNLCLNLNTQSKIIIVKSILDKSIKLKSSKFINWSCLNLLELGFNSKEIKLDLYKKLDSRLINYGLKLDEDFKEFDKIWGKKTKGKFLEKRDFL